MKRVQKILPYVSGVMVAAVVVLGVGQYFSAKKCKLKLLNVLYNNWVQYRTDHNGNWPNDIVTVAGAFPGMGFVETNLQKLAWRVSCPGRGKKAGRGPGTDQFFGDYHYVNWSVYFGTNEAPSGFPLFYDKSLANHRGLGVNIITVEGRAFWDFRGHWIKKFAEEHPEYDIPLPK